VLIIWYLFRYNPELLKRRLATKEKRPGQTVISYLFYASLGVIFMISGLDRRYGWSSVPLILVIISSALFLLGYLFLFLVFRENRYLAHTVTVEKGQEVVTTGPYAVLRHPMYSSELMMFVFAPLALGSYWALLPDVLLIALMAVRIVTEEAVLIRELKGYREYTEKTGYRLIPGVW